MKKLFPLLIAISALAVSASAAFYSVYGLSKLFAGASLQVIIMAGSLEFAKLVTASLLYRYWNSINKVLRIYLSSAVIVLMLITSGGIYGYLSAAYQETATKSEFLDKSLAVVEQKQIRFEEQKSEFKLEKQQISATISDLRTSLSNPVQVQYVDKETGQLITTTSSSARRALQAELDETIIERNQLNLKLEAVQDSILRLDTELLNLEIGNEEQRELGPLKYLSELTGKEMGTVINWFLLLIIFVFDPLAIALVVAANFAFDRMQTKDNIDTRDEYFRQRNKMVTEYTQRASATKKEMDHLSDTADVIMGGLTYDKDRGFAEFIKKQEEVTNEISKEETVDTQVEETKSAPEPKKEDIYKENAKQTDQTRSKGYWF
jgi:hypothetical protein